MRGLSNKEVLDRIKNKQINKCEDNDKNISGILIKNIFTFFNLLNFILFILVLFTAKPLNSLFIIVILLNTIIAIKTELSARKKLKALKLLADNKYSVLREGKIISLNKEEIVKDDLIELKSGDQIVVDGPIIKGDLIVNEANISGESDDVYKNIDDYLYSGSYVIAGKAFQKASQIGSESFVNKMLAKSKQFKHNKSNLLKDLNKILKFVTIFIVPLGILIFIKAQYFLNNFASALLQSSAAMIGMIPEGLILLSSVSLMVSSINLAKKQILVNDLYSLENLAKCDVICLDKTGTLTSGKMSVKDVIYFKDKDFINNIIANFNEHFSDQNQTARALNDYFKLSLKLEIEDSLVFNSKNKYSMIKCNDECFYLGAYDFIPIKNQVHDMTVSKLASEGYRILTLASSKEILAFILLTDELRANIKEIINYLSESDVKCIVISGDDPIMVNQIAKSVGIDTQDNYLNLADFKDDSYLDLVDNTYVFGRVNPTQKEKIVSKLQSKHRVAMVGDGVNDLLALKKADFSISFKTASSAAKNLANIILLDDDFKHVPTVINEGRRVINNISNTSSLFLCKTILSIIMAFLSLVLFKTYPYIPIQLTIISNLLIGTPSFFLSFAKNYTTLKKELIPNALTKAIPFALATSLICIIYHFLFIFNYLNDGEFKTMCYLSTFILLFHILIIIFNKINLFKTIYLIFVLICFSLIYFNLSQYLELNSLSLNKLLLTLALSSIFILINNYLIKNKLA